MILPQFVILPLAILLVWFGLSRETRAAQRAAGAHPRGSPTTCARRGAARAAEIEPLVTSFNDLLARLEQNMALQKRFIADAAHR